MLQLTVSWPVCLRVKHIERTVTKALSTLLRTFSLFKSRRLSSNIELTLYKALIRSVITYACPTLEYAAGAHLLKMHRLQNTVLCAIGIFGTYKRFKLGGGQTNDLSAD
jgi:hypothetical protein